MNRESLGVPNAVYAAATFAIAVFAGVSVANSVDRVSHDEAMVRSYVDANNAAQAVHEQRIVSDDYENIAGGSLVGILCLGVSAFTGNLARQDLKNHGKSH